MSQANVPNLATTIQTTNTANTTANTSTTEQSGKREAAKVKPLSRDIAKKDNLRTAEYNKKNKYWIGIENQSVYRTAMALQLILVSIQARMSKLYKYTLGRDLVHANIDVAKMLRRVWRMFNEPEKQLAGLEELLCYADGMLIQLQICDDARCIPRGQFVEASKMAYSIVEQIVAWKNSVYNKIHGIKDPNQSQNTTDKNKEQSQDNVPQESKQA